MSANTVKRYWRGEESGKSSENACSELVDGKYFARVGISVLNKLGGSGLSGNQKGCWQDQTGLATPPPITGGGRAGRGGCCNRGSKEKASKKHVGGIADQTFGGGGEAIRWVGHVPDSPQPAGHLHRRHPPSRAPFFPSWQSHGETPTLPSSPNLLGGSPTDLGDPPPNPPSDILVQKRDLELKNPRAHLRRVRHVPPPKKTFLLPVKKKIVTPIPTEPQQGRKKRANDKTLRSSFFEGISPHFSNKWTDSKSQKDDCQ